VLIANGITGTYALEDSNGLGIEGITTQGGDKNSLSISLIIVTLEPGTDTTGPVMLIKTYYAGYNKPTEHHFNVPDGIEHILKYKDLGFLTTEPINEGRSRKQLGSGVDHMVFTATDDTDIVYKLGPKIAVDYWFDDFSKNPKIFPKVYKRGKTSMKLKSDKLIPTKKGYKTIPAGTVLPLDYVVLEKLDTKRVDEEWEVLDNMMEEIMEMDDYGFLDLLIVYLTHKPEYKERGWNDDVTIDRVYGQVKQYYPRIAPIFMRYMDITTKIKAVKPGVPDLHRYNFGYDKKGNLKCLDF
jgi:hypothetical protein